MRASIKKSTPFYRKRSALFVLLFAVIGTFLLLRSFAATASVTFSGSLSNKHPVGTHTLNVTGTGTLSASLSYTGKLTNVSLQLLNSAGQVIATGSGGNPSNLTAAVTPATYTFKVTSLASIRGSGNYTLKVTYPTPDTVTDTTNPSVTITAPGSNATVTGAVGLTASASDNVGVSRVEFYADSSLIGTSTASPYSVVWDTATTTNAGHTITAKAYDAAGNTGSSSILVTVNNNTSSVGNPSGQAMPVGDISGWKQVFADDFTTNVALGSFPKAVSSKWWAYPDGWHDTSGHGQYNCTKVCSVQNGLLDLFIHTENGIHYVANPVPLFPGETYNAYDGVHTAWNGQQYGRYVVRFRSDSLPYYKTAWLLWPDSDNWPHDGEIDFPEGDLNKNICAYMHWMYATSGSTQDAYCSNANYQGWHTAILEWTPTHTTFTLDGVVLGNSTSNIPNTKMHWVLQTETALAPAPAPSDTTAGHLQIDWVAGYIPQ